MFDKASVIVALDHHVSPCKGRLGIATDHLAAAHDIAGLMRVQLRRIFVQCVGRVGHSRQRGPRHRERGQVQPGDSVSPGHHSRHSLAPEPGFRGGKYWLVDEISDHAECVQAGDVGGGQDASQVMGGGEPVQIAAGEPGAGVRRPDHFHHQGSYRGDIIAKSFGSLHLGQPVQTAGRSANRA